MSLVAEDLPYCFEDPAAEPIPPRLTLSPEDIREIQLEEQADKLLKQHRAAFDPEYPAVSEKIFTAGDRRRGLPHDLEDLAESNGHPLPIPPEVVARLIRKALDARCSRKQAYCFTLYEAGYSFERVGEIVGLEETKVRRTVRRVRDLLALQLETDESWFRVYCTSLRPSTARELPDREPVPEEIQEARRFIEESQGWETEIRPEDFRFKTFRIRLLISEKRTELLSRRQLLTLRHTGEVTIEGETIRLASEAAERAA